MTDWWSPATTNLFVVIRPGQRLQAVRGELATGRVEFLAVIFSELSACKCQVRTPLTTITDSLLPKLLMVMMKARLSASKPRTSHITSAVSPPIFLQKL